MNTDYQKQLQQDIDALDGERWFPKESEFEDDLPLYWGMSGLEGLPYAQTG